MARGSQFDLITTTLGSDVANLGTFTVGYPANKDAGAYRSGLNHIAASNAYGMLTTLDNTISISFGTTNITITNRSGGTLAAGTQLFIQLEQVRDPDTADIWRTTLAERVQELHVHLVNLGAPDAAVSNGVCASQALNTGVDGLINGSLAAGGVAIFDVPRNVVAAWTNTAVLTVTGLDEYGNVMVESSASGTTMAGAKAFKRITRVRISANATGLTVGTGDVLGLPFFLHGAARVIREIQDGAVATAGTVVAGVTTNPATATTGDPRGTYDPNAACDGARVFELMIANADPSFLGVRHATS